MPTKKAPRKTAKPAVEKKPFVFEPKLTQKAADSLVPTPPPPAPNMEHITGPTIPFPTK